MKLVIVESPYAGEVENNVKYLRKCMMDTMMRDEAGYASHLMYTQFLDDDIPEERAFGIKAGLKWGQKAELTAVYIDRGISAGMIQGIMDAQRLGRTIEFRSIKGED